MQYTGAITNEPDRAVVAPRFGAAQETARRVGRNTVTQVVVTSAHDRIHPRYASVGIGNEDGGIGFVDQGGQLLTLALQNPELIVQRLEPVRGSLAVLDRLVL